MSWSLICPQMSSFPFLQSLTICHRTDLTLMKSDLTLHTSYNHSLLRERVVSKLWNWYWICSKITIVFCSWFSFVIFKITLGYWASSIFNLFCHCHDMSTIHDPKTSIWPSLLDFSWICLVRIHKGVSRSKVSTRENRRKPKKLSGNLFSPVWFYGLA